MSQIHPPKKKFLVRVREKAAGIIDRADQKAVAIQAFLLVIALLVGAFFFNTFEEYKATHAEISALIEIGKAGEYELPTKVAPITQGIGALIVFVAFLMSIRLRGELSGSARAKLTQTVFWIAAMGVMVAWLPADYAVTKSNLLGKAMAGELPSSGAYLGKLLLIGCLILSFPIAVIIHYRSSLMDQYVMRNFMTPFAFCLIGFLSIWVIFDLVDNATDLAGASGGTILKFYIVQVPFTVVFVLPASLLLSLLFSLSKMSTSNELISMISSGRSVLRVLRPLFMAGLFCTLVSLTFKYEWAPNSIGYKESLLSLIKQDRLDKRNNKKGDRGARTIAKLGWMHVNEVDNRTWFVGKVPRNLSKDKMFSVVIWQMGENGQPAVIWKARSAKWLHGLNPPEWWLYAGKTYTYNENGVPRVQSFEKLRLPGWRETPWKVLSSSQNAEHLGFPGLSMYLKSNSDYGHLDLAPFRTNAWDIFSEPFWCFVMVLVSAPLGIVYSRRGVLGGVAASIVIFALMYVTRISLIALGQGAFIPAWIAAWGSNIFFSVIGCVLLWFRAQNREVPKIKTVLLAPFNKGAARVIPKIDLSAFEESAPSAPPVAASASGKVNNGGIDGVLDREALQSLDETLAKIQAGNKPGNDTSGNTSPQAVPG